MSVGDWLGLDESLRGPWSEDRPRVLSDDELGDILGTRPAGLRARLQRSRYLERQSEGSVDDLIALFVERTGAGFAGQASSRDELATALSTLRPLARGVSHGAISR
jgi:hypothetical protein